MAEIYYQAYEAEPVLTREVVRVAASALKTLLEAKHLYQHVTIDVETTIRQVGAKVIGDDRKAYELIAENVRGTTHLSPSSQELFYSTESRGGSDRPAPVLLLLNVKLFCEKCDGRETFAPVWFTDVMNEVRKPRADAPRFYEQVPWLLQIFCLAYQCQTCKGMPTIFIVRRQKWDLFLEGRSPMEVIEVPKFIPKQEVKYYRDAQIAYQSGKTLAALFYLRTFIEQFARRVTGVTARMTGDELMDRYNDTLPSAQRDQMPSLREWYDKVSVPVHAGADDKDVFETANAEIERHFDIRRVYRIPEGEGTK